MPVSFITGNLFTVPDLDALAHGVNCSGAMGAGIAKEFRRSWPAMYEAYRAECRARKLCLGGVFEWHEPTGLVIYNLATQDRPGPGAKPFAIRKAVVEMVRRAESSGVIRIGMPRIGCGLGGLYWIHVRPIIEQAAAKTAVELVVVSLPGDLS